MTIAGLVDAYPNATLEEIERIYILGKLKEGNGNRTAVALRLGISIRGLRLKLAKYRKEGHEIPQKAGGDRG